VTRKRPIKLTRFEMEIMDALWELGSGSIREVHESLPEKRRPAYTTVQTIIRRLEEKGAVRQTKQVGHAHIFEPAFTRDAAHRRLIDELLDLFGGSARPLMAHLAEAGKLTLEDVKELEGMLAERQEQPQVVNLRLKSSSIRNPQSSIRNRTGAMKYGIPSIAGRMVTEVLAGFCKSPLAGDAIRISRVDSRAVAG
jgi:predicted transcriptional regulator